MASSDDLEREAFTHARLTSAVAHAEYKRYRDSYDEQVRALHTWRASVLQHARRCVATGDQPGARRALRFVPDLNAAEARFDDADLLPLAPRCFPELDLCDREAPQRALDWLVEVFTRDVCSAVGAPVAPVSPYADEAEARVAEAVASTLQHPGRPVPTPRRCDECPPPHQRADRVDRLVREVLRAWGLDVPHDLDAPDVPYAETVLQHRLGASSAGWTRLYLTALAADGDASHTSGHAVASEPAWAASWREVSRHCWSVLQEAADVLVHLEVHGEIVAADVALHQVLATADAPRPPWGSHG
ncbi:MAG: hypothetical protein ACTHN8_16225 [Angustibacter sp.]